MSSYSSSSSSSLYGDNDNSWRDVHPKTIRDLWPRLALVSDPQHRMAMCPSMDAALEPIRIAFGSDVRPPDDFTTLLLMPPTDDAFTAQQRALLFGMICRSPSHEDLVTVRVWKRLTRGLVYESDFRNDHAVDDIRRAVERATGLPVGQQELRQIGPCMTCGIRLSANVILSDLDFDDDGDIDGNGDGSGASRQRVIDLHLTVRPGLTSRVRTMSRRKRASGQVRAQINLAPGWHDIAIASDWSLATALVGRSASKLAVVTSENDRFGRRFVRYIKWTARYHGPTATLVEPGANTVRTVQVNGGRAWKHLIRKAMVRFGKGTHVTGDSIDELVEALPSGLLCRAPRMRISFAFLDEVDPLTGPLTIAPETCAGSITRICVVLHCVGVVVAPSSQRTSRHQAASATGLLHLNDDLSVTELTAIIVDDCNVNS
ncbi:hypothetical protein PBRA_009000 [Plasmodiophora brassicae]|nr:hypothetical protein PBRA_009000 [Plasmodiophora brassicae]